MKLFSAQTANWLRQRAENVAAALLVAMFLAFIFQIIARYVFNWPVGWTTEVCILAWLWGVLWGAAFVLREDDEIRFDILYSAVSDRARRIFTIATGVALVVLYTVALPAVTDYVTFMKVERSAFLKIRFDWLFSIYVLFAVGVILRYVWLTWRAIRGDVPDIDPTKPGAAL
ncbi:TRAP transporter small permease subunit [Ferrovibrio terrae]|uniref:TRAP transporter small permease n=1 Tax=Ferrovibrio terrae TaxID=2594003 RepID=UPI0031379887